MDNKRKYSRDDLLKMDAVEVYILVLEGKYIKKFPDGFWTRPDAYENAKKCLKWLIEDYLRLTEEDIKNIYDRKFLSKYKLAGMMNCCFNGSAFKTIEFIYPQKFKPWELKFTTNGLWRDKDNGIEAVKWLIETKLNYTDYDILNNLTVKTFSEYGLSGMLQHCFNSSIYNSVNSAYPGRFQPWEFKTTPACMWKDKSNGIKAVKWLIEDKLGYTPEDIRQKISTKTFKENGLAGMLIACFSGSVYKAINTAYPGQFKKEEFKSYTFYPGMYDSKV